MPYVLFRFIIHQNKPYLSYLPYWTCAINKSAKQICKRKHIWPFMFTFSANQKWINEPCKAYLSELRQPPKHTHTHTLPFCLRWGCHSDSLTDTQGGERGGGGGDEKSRGRCLSVYLPDKTLCSIFRSMSNREQNLPMDATVPLSERRTWKSWIGLIW